VEGPAPSPQGFGNERVSCLLSAVLLCCCACASTTTRRTSDGAVYDALNVLMAMDIISKEKKEIKWKGLPPSAGSQEMLQHERLRVEERLEKKRQSHQELQEQVSHSYSDMTPPVWIQ